MTNIALAIMLYSVHIFYGPPVLLTVYVEPPGVESVKNGGVLEDVVRPSLCAALLHEPDIALPVRYDAVALVRSGAREVPGEMLGTGTLLECPPSGGTPA